MTAKTAKRKRIPALRSLAITLLSLTLVAALIKNSEAAGERARLSLSLCAQMLLPSLFPLTVAGEIATLCGALEKISRAVSAPLSKLLGMSRIALSPYLLGLVGGYASSSRSALLLLENGSIDADECERVIALSNIPSLAFLTGFVGGGICNDTGVGIRIWMITVASGIISAVITAPLFPKNNRKIKKEELRAPVQNNDIRVGRIVSSAISHGAQTMISICACVVFFSVLIGLLESAAARLGIRSDISDLVLGALEMTEGVRRSAKIADTSKRAVLCSAYSGWSGLCIHLQVISICDTRIGKQLRFSRYFLIKATQGLVSAAIAAIVF